MLASRGRPFPGVATTVFWLCGVCAGPRYAAEPVSVINELHVNSDVKTELVECVELCDLKVVDVDLSGWQLTDGVFFTFQPGATLPASGCVVVAPEQELP